MLRRFFLWLFLSITCLIIVITFLIVNLIVSKIILVLTIIGFIIIICAITWAAIMGRNL